MTTNAVLIGLMGSGKSTVGQLVSEKSGMEFIDLDGMIVSRAGMPISEIFDTEGEEGFRQRETETLREVMSATHAVIATGGGVVMRAENRRLLRELGKVFWLDAPADVLLERIGDDESRPMLRGDDTMKRLEQLLAERREWYADASDIHFDTTELGPEELADRVIQEMKSRWVGADEDVFSTIIAIDGPVGSGKSTLAKRIADRLGFVHIDTGAMYRCVTLEAMTRKVPLTDPTALTAVAHSIDIRFLDADSDALAGSAAVSEHKRVLLNGEDVTEMIRSPDVSRNTSPVADVPTVRAELVRLQRQLALRGRSVLEGRDISTVVVPEAKWKFYLVASLEERIRRRHAQYVQEGREIDPVQLREDIICRDERDRSRAQGALKLASDATILDTTGMPLDEVVDIVASMVENGGA
jgi:cytidylate kinase